VGQDIPKVELLLAQGAFEEAWLRLREENPFPGVCGRVCFHPCEGSCNRKEYDEPVSINGLERFLADHAWKQGITPPPVTAAATGKRIAVVGAGPAGLSAAYFLRRFGHAVDLFDAREEAGGMLRYAIPEYRLPKEALAWEVSLILSDGVRFSPGRLLGRDLTWEELSRFDAVYLAIGNWAPSPLDVPGEELARDGLALLEAVRRGERPSIDGRVAVIGGGDTAMDVARTLLRLGSHPEIVYRRRIEDMPALPEEVEEAREEGIPFRTLLSPSHIRTAEDGLLELELAPMRAIEGEGKARARVVPSGEPPVTMRVSAVFSAIGASHSEGLPRESADPSRTVTIGPHLRLLPEGGWKGRTPVFLGGDLVNDAKTVVTAIASGKEAAVVIDASFRGIVPENILPGIRIGKKGAVSMNRYLEGDRGKRQDHVVRFEEINAIYFGSLERKARPRVTLGERRTGFDEVKMRISGSMAIREAERCFHCGLCDQCDNCYLFCPDIAVVRDQGANRREIDYDYCKGCGICVVECPRNAMVLEEEPG
jgi:2-oxoacid:acceptor oxidoreductase delta subunit (pyruvate/2-ketoisovalerate family)